MEQAEKRGRRQQAVESKNRIYEAAIALFAERGFEEASVKDIVARAGVSVGAFYHHFPSKEAILEENFRRADERFSSLNSKDGEPSEPLEGEEAAELVVEYMARYGRFVEKVTGLDLSKRIYTPKNKLFIKRGRPMQTVLASIISEGISSGELVTDLSAEAACEWLFIGARGLAFHWCLKEGKFCLEEAMRDYARRALRALEPLD